MKKYLFKENLNLSKNIKSLWHSSINSLPPPHPQLSMIEITLAPSWPNFLSSITVSLQKG